MGKPCKRNTVPFIIWNSVPADSRITGDQLHILEANEMQEKRVALITGANKGIGLQIAKDLSKNGLTVLVGSRNLANGETAARTVAEDVHAIQLDVTDAASIAACSRAHPERVRPA
jgi:NADP-dependent 3-hydroxy acid dehydrogenase YdfG